MEQDLIQIYRTSDGETRIDVRFERDTLWLSLLQMAELFGRDKSVISRHLKNIFDTVELSREATVAKTATVPTVESKAAHLLYFVVKNHPFSDGNKRSGAFMFVDFLHRNRRLLNARGEAVINDTGLAALTLLVAESDPKQKETLIRLIMNMLAMPGAFQAGEGA
jgi:prophage maintenance system killer protein